LREPGKAPTHRLRSAIADAIIAALISFLLFCLTLGMRTVDSVQGLKLLPRPLLLAIVVGIAVLREGSEVVLFLYGIAVSDGGSPAALVAGALGGFVLGAAVSALTFFGLLRIPARHLFAVTSTLIALLAAGLAAQCAAFLELAGVLNVLSDTAWDSSAILSDKGIPGRILHTLVGYSDQPSYMQVVVYVVTLAIIFSLMRVLSPPPRSATRTA